MDYGLKKILNVEQIRAADQFTIDHEPISSIDLMERASIAFVQRILEERIEASSVIAVVCGTGNNGGDGLAVARLLSDKGYTVNVYLIKFSPSLSPDCEINLQRLDDVNIIESEAQIPSFKNYDVLIDSIFGSGINKPVHGIAADVIHTMNRSGTIIYSIDVPSGLMCDELTNSNCIIESDLTISFQRPKFSFFYPENNKYIKAWTVVDIGLDIEHIQNQDSKNFILDADIINHVKDRAKHSHKGTYGHALIIAGSYGKIGAAVLSARACLRSGAGLLSVRVPKCGYEIIQETIPDAMCTTDAEQNKLSEFPDIDNYNSIGIGPGIGTDLETSKVVRKLLERCEVPLVLDADAINIISRNKELIELLPANCVLTPHPKEFDLLLGASNNSEDRLKKQKQFSKDTRCILVLKGANTSVSSPDGELFFNTSGNSGMATGGSGDVLTGIITGLLAQGYDPLLSALIGVYFHGKAGDDFVAKRGMNALMASDLVESLCIEGH